MGAWGHDTFHNDTACDFTSELTEATDLGVVEGALNGVLESDEDYLDSDEACEALAACEVLARLQGRWGVRDAYSEELDAWIVAHPQTPPKALLDRAVKTIDRICGEKSELPELWEGQDVWVKAIADLRARVVG